MSENKVEKAIRNNNGLYNAIFDSHGIGHGQNGTAWYSLEEAPSFYSNLVTTSPDWQPDEIFEDIDKKYAGEQWRKWSMKDSFCKINLSRYGLTKLFEAQWIYLSAPEFKPSQTTSSIRYDLIKDELALSTWINGWDGNETEKLGAKIFAPSLLQNSDIHFVGGYESERLVAGFLINVTENVLGISNFFAPNEDIKSWTSAIKFVYATFGVKDIVGYEQGDRLSILQVLGFQTTGKLAVWLKKRE